jgi:murein DD-endopeptidase MepM/ murein hydrolase activator NlpD
MHFGNKTKIEKLTRETITDCRKLALRTARKIRRSSETAFAGCKVKAEPVLGICMMHVRGALLVCAKGVDIALAGFETGVEAVLSPIHNHKKIAIAAASLCAILIISVSAASSSHTFYEYSVGGQVLGVVKDEKMVARAVENSSVKINRTDENVVADETNGADASIVPDLTGVTVITEGAIPKAAAKDKEDSIVAIPASDGAKVVINKDEDIVVQKKIVTDLKDIKIDKGEDIIEKITKLEDVDVVAYTLSIDDRTFGPFESREAAQSILDRVQGYWLGEPVPEKYREVGFGNEVAVKEISAPKAQLIAPGGVYDEIMKGVLEYKEYTVKDGDTLFDIAIDNDLTIEKIEELNPTANLEVIYTGDKLRLEEEKTILSVKTVEEIEYDETFKANPVYNDTDKLYVGEEIVSSEGSKGERHVTADLTSKNGKASELQVTATDVLRESVPDRIMRGTKKLPPLIGKGYFIMPANAGITSGFKYRWGKHHDGIDIGVRYGSVVAADGGEVIFAGNRSDGYGNKIIINHGGGRQTLYAHLSEINVNVGEKVFQGQRIATSGNTGSSTGPHLHFEVHINGVPKDPMDYL